MLNEYISVRAAAKKLGMSVPTYYRRSKEGVLPSGVKIGGLRRIDPDALNEAVAKLAEEGD